MRISALRALAALLLVSLGARPGAGQGTVVVPGPARTLVVNGQQFYPLGWNLVGTCTAADAPAGVDNRAIAAEALERLRASGTNTLLELPFADGRLIPRSATPQRGNWYGYRFTDREGRAQAAGHARPGVYVEALAWLMDLAARSQRPIYMFVPVSSFIVPGLEATPHGGSDVLPCSRYRAFIEDDRAATARHDPARAARIPPVSCEGQPSRPFWEWNVWYVVTSLRDHPGLLGWYLMDEPEGDHLRHLFGAVEPNRPVRAYGGPPSLPTPDLLRYAYDLVIRFETEGRDAAYRRHPVLVDVYNPQSFASRRFRWSNDGRRNPAWDSGPFDRRPDGSFRVPADLLGLDVSNHLARTAGGAADGVSVREHDWWVEPGYISRAAAALRELVDRDDLWSALVIQGQAQLGDLGPGAISEQNRCTPNLGHPRTRLLNDRDLVWLLLTTQADGLRGYLQYAHNLLPAHGPGAEMEARINRLMMQFTRAGLARAFATTALPAASVSSVEVDELTAYFRSDPDFVGPAGAYDPGRSPAPLPRRTYRADEYAPPLFGRTDASGAYGHAATPAREEAGFPGHRHLRTSIHRTDASWYLVISNAYDARIRAELTVDGARAQFEEGVFDLDAADGFRWRSPARATVGPAGRPRTALLRIALEPYEARLFRLPVDDPQ